VAAAYLEMQGPLVDHVLVDEGQDLSPVHWQMLRALVAPGPDDLFLAEDSHQRIYSSPVVLGRYGIRIVGRSRRLTLNYRTTAQNLRNALGILEGGSYVGPTSTWRRTQRRPVTARHGPVPFRA
jgi:superfamily I DNA/RNA helicase